MDHHHKIEAFVPSPGRLFLQLLVTIFSVEAVIMLFLATFLPEEHSVLTSIADAVMLVVLSAPLLWYIMVRPLRSAADAEQIQAATIVSQSMDGIITANEKGLIVSFNPAAESMFGYGAGEALGKPLTMLMPERYRETHQEGLKRAESTGESRVIGKIVELPGLRRDGNEFPLELSLTAPGAGKEKWYTGIVRDITDRKRAESALAETTSRVQLLQEVATAANENSTLEEVMSRMLERVCSSIGWPVGHVYLLERDGAGDLVSKAIWYVNDPDRFKTFREVTEVTRFAVGEGLPGRVVASKKPEWIPDVTKEPRFFRASLAEDVGVRTGFGVPVMVGRETVAVLEFYSDKVIELDKRLLEVMVDIGTQLGRVAERERSEKDKQLQLQRIQTLHEIQKAITSTLDLAVVLELLLEKIDLLLPYSASAIRLVNRETGESKVLATRNIDIKGLESAQVMSGGGFSHTVIESRASLFVRNVQAESSSVLSEFFSKEGLVSYLGLPLIAGEENLGVLSILTKEEHQFTDDEIEFLSTLANQAAAAVHNTQLYAQIRNQAIQLQKADNAKEEFLGFVSHELKTPLNTLLGYVELMRDGMFGEINQEQGNALAKVAGCSQELLTMINSLLEARKIEAGAGGLVKDEVNLGDFLNELKAAYAIPEKKTLALKWQYSSALPVIKTDSEKLRHILQNLINNAIKYTEEGQVTVTARIKDSEGQQATEKSVQGNGATAQTSERKVEFKVMDTGIGIPGESLLFIFERFHQVNGSQAKRSGGVGLGLHIVKKFTELLGGEIDVESEPGKGSVFTVVIPG